MQSRTDLDPQLSDALSDVERTPDRASRAVECGVEAVTRRVGLDATPPLKRVPNDGVVSLDQVLPGAISQRGLPLGRADDVGEQDGGEDGVELGPRQLDADETPNLI